MTTTTGSRTMPHPAMDELDLPAVLFALSDPARLDLVRFIAAEGPQTVAQCHVVDPDVPKSTFSHHLKTLREAGVVRNEPDGRQRRISLRRADLEARFPGLLAAVLATGGTGSRELLAAPPSGPSAPSAPSAPSGASVPLGRQDR